MKSKLADYVAKKDKLKKAGYDTSALKDDFKTKFTKLETAQQKLAEAQKDCSTAREDLQKTTTAYKTLLLKFENANIRDKSKKVVCEAADEVATWLSKLEQELLAGAR
jgi:hypothetical protein